MKRHELYRKIWQDCNGILKAGSHIAIIGGGISGLHLAWFFGRQKIRVTVFEPGKTGSLRVPLMHACCTLKKRPQLWEAAANFSRRWYSQNALETQCLSLRENPFGEYFVIRTRAYLLFLKNAVLNQGATIVQRKILREPTGYDLVVVAAGAKSQGLLPGQYSAATFQIHGWESYFCAHGAEPRFTAEQAECYEVTTNFMTYSKRAGLIHRNSEERADAQALARSIFPGQRSALFEGVRLAAADRNPIVGFCPPGEINTYDKLKVKFQKENYAALASRSQSPFFFTAMGYHAMTYGPFLAHSVAGWLTGNGGQNMICTLTPARFLPRS